MEADVVEAEVVDEPGTELAETPSNLFRSNNPVEVLTRARETADAFKPIVAAHSVSIQGRQHVTVEGWQILGAMLGVTPVCEWTHKLEDGWEARVEARTLDGRVVGAAEAECLRSENQWKSRDDYALRSMAQTRATSKALASVLRFVAVLAGVEGTPAEEMPREGAERRSYPASDKQLEFLARLLKQGGADEQLRLLIGDYARRELTGGRNGSMSKVLDGLNGDNAQEVFDNLKASAEAWNSRQSDVPADDSDLPPVEEVA